jgi:hypothetical protein
MFSNRCSRANLCREGLDKIRTEIQKHSALLERIDISTRSLRDANPEVEVRKSLFNKQALETTRNVDGCGTKNDNSVVDTVSYQRNRALSQINSTLAPVTKISAPPEGDLIDLSDEVASPPSGSAHLSPLESMWNMNAVLPTPPETKPSSEGITISADNTFHTVRGLSSRDQPRTHKRSARSTSQRAERVRAANQEAPRPDATGITSQPSLPLSISPKLIHFSTPCELEQAKSLPFTNTNPFPVTYKVSTTRPQCYAVRPNFGTLLPDQTIDVQFILMEVLVGSEEELKRRDKFRIQSVPVEDVAHGSMFDWKADKAGARIEEVKIKVELVMKEEGADTGTSV